MRATRCRGDRGARKEKEKKKERDKLGNGQGSLTPFATYQVKKTHVGRVQQTKTTAKGVGDDTFAGGKRVQPTQNKKEKARKRQLKFWRVDQKSQVKTKVKHSNNCPSRFERERIVGILRKTKEKK